MNRVEELEKLLIHHKALYYQGRPSIPDYEYDALEEELQKLNPKSSVLQLIGTNVTKSDKKIKHESKMLSLNKTYTIEELLKWKGEKDVISTYKIDGVSCSLIYEDGALSLAKTRGDGSFGEDITDKVKWISSAPKRINLKSRKLEVRGELYCVEDEFFRLSDEMVHIGLEKPTSQRNIVAGLVSRKENPELCRYLCFKAFDLITDDKEIKTEVKKYQLLSENSFIIPEVLLHSSEKSISEAIREAEEFMAEGDYQIDGLVFSYNDLSLHNQLGETAHHPRYKMAYKFKGDSKTTTIELINWYVSRNGFLTPVASVEPVELSGAMISNVTLHNYGLVKQYDLKIGDQIEIIRSGEVIPKFLSVVSSSNNKFSIPEKCPSCDSEVYINDIRLMCSNDRCPGKNKESILNFIKKIGIDDLSSKRLDELIKHGLVTDIPDLYTLDKDDLIKMDKVKDKLANKILDNIANSKNVDLVTFMSALGIQGGAYNKCEKVYHAGYNSIDKLRNLEINELAEIEGFAEKSATEFVHSIKSKFKQIDRLLELGFSFKAPEFVPNENVVSKSFCITGALSVKRSVIEDMIRKSGGIVVSGVSKNTDYLVTNEPEPGSSKFKKAQTYNTKIISEAELNELLTS